MYYIYMQILKLIKMEITSFIIFIRGDLLSDIHSEIEFYGSAKASS